MNKHRITIPESLEKKDTVELLAHILHSNFSHTSNVIISFGGTGGVGKSTITKKLASMLKDASVLPLDDYKTPRSERSKRKILGSHPAANRFDLLHEHFKHIKAGRSFHRPVYNAISGEIDNYEPYKPAKYNLIDGEISTYNELYHYADVIIFIEATFKTQLKTRLKRDVKERGSSLAKVFRTFVQSNLIDYHRFGIQAKDKADILLYCHDDYAISTVSINKNLVTKL